MDTTKFDAANKDNVQTVGITDDYDETKVDVDGSAIKAYDSVTGADVTDKFDINVENGVMTATLKAGLTKSLGDAENTQIIDTTKFEFGRYTVVKFFIRNVANSRDKYFSCSIVFNCNCYIRFHCVVCNGCV